MKRKYFTVLALSLLLFLPACSALKEGDAGSLKEESAAEAAETTYRRITADEAKKMMDAGGVTIVDVRTLEEYQEAHVTGAVNVPVENIAEEAWEALPDKEAALIVYCRSGVRSKQASDKLTGLGYQNVNDMGGIIDWTYETESGSSRPA